MSASNYKIRATADSIDVERDGPFQSRKSGLFFGVYAILSALAMLYFSFFGSGHKPGIWVMLADLRPGLPRFTEYTFLAAFTLVICGLFLATGIRHLLPFGERMHCDRSTLIWSKIPWVSFGNRWVTRSIPVSEITASYAIVYKSKGVYGILLESQDMPWKLFWGIETPEANRILRGLKGLGVNVHRDSEMRESIREALRDRRAQL
jgi:hypothetical protein